MGKIKNKHIDNMNKQNRPPKRTKNKGWRGETQRHSLAARGIKTGTRNSKTPIKKTPIRGSSQWYDARGEHIIEIFNTEDEAVKYSQFFPGETWVYAEYGPDGITYFVVDNPRYMSPESWRVWPKEGFGSVQHSASPRPDLHPEFKGNTANDLRGFVAHWHNAGTMSDEQTAYANINIEDYEAGKITYGELLKRLEIQGAFSPNRVEYPLHG